MADAPLIGIPTLTDRDAQGHHPVRFSNNTAYSTAVLAGGGIPVLLPLITDRERLRTLYTRLDGLLLPGGVDVDPALYGETALPETESPDPPRDAVELDLLRWALADDLPVLGVCRGHQVLNVALGGTLWQDLARQRPDSLDHRESARKGQRDLLTHPVELAPDSRLAALAGGAGELPVNTLHHQAIRDLGADLRPVAWSPDGLCEGLELPGRAFVLAVQWHPEELVNTQAAAWQLFAAFCAAAAARGASQH
jgi:putative glutamine amidotransferase